MASLSLSITISRGSLSCGISDHFRGTGGGIVRSGRTDKSFSREGTCLAAGPSSFEDERFNSEWREMGMKIKGSDVRVQDN